MKAVGWSEIQARAIRENLDLPFHGALLVGWEPPREARNLFPIYRQFLHYELSSHIYGLIPLPWSAPTFPPRRENLVPGGNLADNANSLSPIFPPLHSTCLSPMATQVNKGACGTMVSLMTVFVKLSALPVLRPFKKPCPSVLSSDYCSLSEKLSSLLTTLKLFTPNFSWPSASFGGQLWAMGIGQ